MPDKFSQYVSRSQMEDFQWTQCMQCHESVVKARVRTTQKEQMFEPKPVGGTEMDPAYDRHLCKKSA